MTIESARCITQALVIGTPLVWVAWDLYAMLRFGPSATESDFIWSINERHRWFSLALGLAGVALYWHFFLE